MHACAANGAAAQTLSKYWKRQAGGGFSRRRSRSECYSCHFADGHKLNGRKSFNRPHAEIESFSAIFLLPPSLCAFSPLFVPSSSLSTDRRQDH